jgi:hypothetical protein
MLNCRENANTAEVRVVNMALRQKLHRSLKLLQAEIKPRGSIVIGNHDVKRGGVLSGHPEATR